MMKWRWIGKYTLVGAVCASVCPLVVLQLLLLPEGRNVLAELQTGWLGYAGFALVGVVHGAVAARLRGSLWSVVIAGLLGWFVFGFAALMMGLQLTGLRGFAGPNQMTPTETVYVVAAGYTAALAFGLVLIALEWVGAVRAGISAPRNSHEGDGC